jgi:hypothetical protein
MIAAQRESAQWGLGAGIAEQGKFPQAKPTPAQPLRATRRCPWFFDVVRLAARPREPYSAWQGAAVIFAGGDAWARARAVHDRGCRAVTCLPNEDPASLLWPAVRYWIGDAGDLEAERVIELARALVRDGAEVVILVAKNVAGRVLVARRGAA